MAVQMSANLILLRVAGGVNLFHVHLSKRKQLFRQHVVLLRLVSLDLATSAMLVTHSYH